MAILEVRGLVKFYGRRKVVDGVSFDVKLGEVVGLLGPNGAGKTTSFRMTTGQTTPNEGQVLFDGKDVTHLPMYRRARLGMGYLAQEHSVFRKLSVEQNVLAILEAMPASRSLGRKLRRAERWDRCDKVLDQFGLTHVRKNNAWSCSGGEKRRLEIARCLVCEPLLILLDEPFAGVDPMTKAEIRQTVAGLAKKENIGILLTDHDIREVLKVTDRSYLIKDGKVRMHGTPEEWVRDPVAVNEYLGTTFSDDGIGISPTEGRAYATMARDAGRRVPPPAAHAAPVPHAPEPGGPEPAEVLEADRVYRLIETLKVREHANHAGLELIRRGPAAVPALIDALERREPELRERAFTILKNVVRQELTYHADGPPDQRRAEAQAIRDWWGRHTGQRLAG